MFRGSEARANEPVQKDDSLGPGKASLIASLGRGKPAKTQGTRHIFAEARRCRYNPQATDSTLKIPDQMSELTRLVFRLSDEERNEIQGTGP